MVKFVVLAFIVFMVYVIYRGIKSYNQYVKEEETYENEVMRGKSLSVKAKTALHRKKNDEFEDSIEDYEEVNEN